MKKDWLDVFEIIVKIILFYILPYAIGCFLTIKFLLWILGL